VLTRFVLEAEAPPFDGVIFSRRVCLELEIEAWELWRAIYFLEWQLLRDIEDYRQLDGFT
jgi:hypothetical protein